MSTLGQRLSEGATGVANHLWQTTVFVTAIWFLTLLLRRKQARVRMHFGWLHLSSSSYPSLH